MYRESIYNVFNYLLNFFVVSEPVEEPVPAPQPSNSTGTYVCPRVKTQGEIRAPLFGYSFLC